MPAPDESPAPSPWPARSSGSEASGRRSRRSTGACPRRRRLAMLLRARILLERATRWLLRNRPQAARHRGDGRALRRRRGRARRGAAHVARPAEERGRAGAGPPDSTAVGVPPELAQRVAHLESLVPTLDLVEVAAAAEVDVAARPPSTSRSASGSTCTGCATGSSTCPGRRAGRRWRAQRCGTTSTPSRRA